MQVKNEVPLRFAPPQKEKPIALTSQFVSVGLFIVWCLANSLYATDAHTLLHTSDHAHLYVELTLCQIIISTLMVLPLVSRKTCFEAAYFAHQTTNLISAAHFTGALLSNSSYAILGATSTLVWKLSEPFATALFKIFILKEQVLPIRLYGIAIVVIGVLTFSDFNLSNSLSFSPIVLANIAFPLRNILMKMNQKQAATQISYDPQVAFLSLQLHALPFAICALLLKWCKAPLIPYEIINNLVTNSCYFAAYQMASIALLARLDSLTHAVASLFRRFSSILVTACFLHTIDFLPRHILGFALTFTGFPLYALGGFIDSKFKLKKAVRDAVKPTGIIYLCLFAFLFSSGCYSRPTIESTVKSYDVSPTVDSTPLSTDAAPIWARETRKPLFPQDGIERNLRKLSKMENPIQKKSFVYQTPNYGFSNMTYGNYGNGFWLHAAINIMPNFSSLRLCKSAKREFCSSRFLDVCNTSILACKKDKKNHSDLLFYYPTANAFNVNYFRQFGTEVNNMEKYGDIFLIIGVGIQEYFQKGSKFCGIRTNGKIETKAEDFKFTENGYRVLAIHEKLKLPITFRGDFTARAAQKAGYNYGISLGCPSLMLNANPDIGQVLARKYEALKNRIGDRTLKIAVNIKNTCEGFVPIFARILRDYPNAVVFAQHRKEVEDAARVGFPPERVRGYLNINEWRKAIEPFDVSIGVRIHGSMAALSEGIPAFVIATDHRVLELVERMLIPHTNTFDKRLVPGLDVADLVSSAEFNANAYDQNRCETAATYQKLYRRYGIPVSKHVEHIAKRCI